MVGVMRLGRSSIKTQTFIRTLKRAEKIFERTISDLKQLTSSFHVGPGGAMVQYIPYYDRRKISNLSVL